MDDQDYSELRIRLMAHQVLLCAALATHPNKPEFLAAMAQVTNQMQSLLLPSQLDDKALAAFDGEIHSILRWAGMTQDD